MAQQSPWIVETSTAGFQPDVVERSKERLVVLDCWAPWCEPCRQLGPVLEKLAVEYGGKFVLVKLDIDQSPDVAQALRVQSIPYVVAVRDGQFVTDFMGVMPEGQLREWLAALLPSRADELVQDGVDAEGRDRAEAESLYREALEADPEHVPAKIHLAQVLLAQNRDAESRQIIDELERRGWLEPEAERVKSQLELRAAAEEAGSIQEARRALEARPEDAKLRLQLADALAVAGKHTEAMELCLDVIRRDRAGFGDEARKTMLRIFDILGSGSPLVLEYRKKLATALY
ncbi:MAG TPA: tetratricopeptide repeat protein [Planctomycetaceae bacterium]|nr:tetratricopeptide repeat protein [Planctomycetaceae bacterium]